MSGLKEVEYKVYYCEVHKKYIHYFKSNDHVTGFYHCWDCVYERNKKKSHERNNGTDPGEH